MNLFADERRKFEPTLPKIFKEIGTLTVQEGENFAPHGSIANLLPHICKQPALKFRHEEGVEHTPLNVGVVLSGGQAAGGHNVICGLFFALKKLNEYTRLFGFLSGPSGIIGNKYIEITPEMVAQYKNTGGFDMIGSGRTKIETPEQLESALQTCTQLNLDGLVIIGGDDSNTNAAILAEYFLSKPCKTKVIGVPKTIDGDLKNAFVEASFGFDTACKIYSEMIGNICRDALSSKKYTHFIKLMGRSASHIALECALQTRPNVTIIGEECASQNMTLRQITDRICDVIVQRAEEGRNYGVILIPEGLIEFIPEMNQLIQEINKGTNESLSRSAAETFNFLPKEIREQLLLERDPHGNVQVSQIATEQLLIHAVKKRLKERTDFKGKFSPLAHFLGYEGRCGYPSNFDANYTYALGMTAALLISQGKTGYLATVQKLTEHPTQWEPQGSPLAAMMHVEERAGKKKPVIQKAHVDLNDEPFKFFASHRKEWALNDNYRFPGPIQYFGPETLTNETTFTLQLEKHTHLVSASA